MEEDTIYRRQFLTAAALMDAYKCHECLMNARANLVDPFLPLSWQSKNMPLVAASHDEWYPTERERNCIEKLNVATERLIDPEIEQAPEEIDPYYCLHSEVKPDEEKDEDVERDGSEGGNADGNVMSEDVELEQEETDSLKERVTALPRRFSE
ncbi:hypothetical protein B0A48_12227 [Cryoendolithus antarcticus]|uniref:Uncharacterized protein n=1 Tax=Cryoendolithus antarcticus TaxID=1507870 RepID=A0A1V8SUM0_9PEZI|nr:hypothetical protein B0A48_12227 [Cryoendolithus antarcticus]